MEHCCLFFESLRFRKVVHMLDEETDGNTYQFLLLLFRNRIMEYKILHRTGFQYQLLYFQVETRWGGRAMAVSQGTVSANMIWHI